MKQLEFMNRLDVGIRSLSYDERREILSDYEEHFARGKEAGKSEEKVCDGLGDPDAIARDYISQGSDATQGAYSPPREEPRQPGAYSPPKRETQPRTPNYQSPNYQTPDWAKALIAIAVILLNIFVVFPFWISIASVLVAIFFVFVALIVAGFIAIAYCSIQIVFLFAGIALVSLGILGAIGLVYAIKYFAIGTRMYIQMNGRLIKEGRI